MKKSAPFFLLIVALCLCSAPAAHAAAPEGFRETPMPEKGSPEWIAMNRAISAFAVDVVDGRLVTGPAKSRSRCALVIPGGVLIGENDGEWGGNLMFKPSEGPKREILIKEGNITAIFLFQGKIHVLEGLAHLGTNEGALYILEPQGDSFLPKLLFTFDSAPYAAAPYGDTLLILAHDAFFTIHDGEKTAVFSKTFWGALYPNSLAAIDLENVYCGLRGGILKLNVKNRRMELYTPVQ